MENDGLDRLGRLQDSLYSRGNKSDATFREHRLSQKSEADLPTDFVHEVPEEAKIFPEKKENIMTKVKDKFKNSVMHDSFPIMFFIFSFIFFSGAAFYTYLKFVSGDPFVSPQNIEVKMTGPVSIPAGDRFALDLSIVNNNKVELSGTVLTVEYPQGTHNSENPEIEMPRDRILVGYIKPGEVVHKRIEAILFGDEKSVSKIKFAIDYRIPNSNSVYTKEFFYDVTIQSSPVSFKVDMPTEISSGQVVPISISIRSNAPEILKNVGVKVKYPLGFSYKSSDITPATSANDFFVLGDIPQGGERHFNIKGILSGENEDERTFEVSSGLIGEGMANSSISTQFVNYKSAIAIKKPFIGVNLSINNNSSPEVSVKSNGDIEVKLSYINNLPVSVTDVVLKLSVVGTGLDKTAVSVKNGVYQSLSNTIIWDKTSLPSLSELAPGEGGDVEFVLSPRIPLTDTGNPQILLSANVKGNRINELDVTDEVTNVAKRLIKIDSAAQFLSEASFNGALNNTGPIPPKVEKETTYTITWTINNPSSDLSNVSVSSVLPRYVRFIGEVTPSSEVVSYNEGSGVVTWKAGDVKTGVGYNNEPSRKISFKVGFTPSANQVGTTPDLTDYVFFKAKDSFTDTEINVKKQPLTIRVSNVNSLGSGASSVTK